MSVQEQKSGDVESWLCGAVVFFGELSAAAARVYVELAGEEGLQELSIEGQIVGPFSDYSRTLTTTIRLTELPPGATRLQTALVPDPCCWTPLLPFVYTLQLTALQAGQVIATCERTFGLRPLGARGDDLFMDGKRIVMRGVDRQFATQQPVEAWRESNTTLLTRGVDEELLEHCTTHGLLTCVQLRGDEATIVSDLKRLGRHVSVGIALLDAAACSDAIRAAKPRNLLLAAEVDAGMEPPTDVDLIAYATDDPVSLPERFAAGGRPRLVILNCAESMSWQESRARCDQLQAELAGRGRLAGYMVRTDS